MDRVPMGLIITVAIFLAGALGFFDGWVVGRGW